MTALQTTSDVSPRYSAIRRAVPTPLVSEVRALCEREIRNALSAVQAGASGERLVSAWSHGCGFVQAAVQRMTPSVRSAIGASDLDWADLGEVIDATLFFAADSRPEGTHAHQDLAYRWSRPVGERYAYTTWVPLDRCDEDGGALRFARTKPRMPVEERQDFLREDFNDLALSMEWTQDDEVLCAEPGDLVVFDACTWHASVPFRRPGRRAALALRWTSQSLWERATLVPRPVLRDPQFGMDNSGEFLRAAIRQAVGRRGDTEVDGSLRDVLVLLCSRADLMSCLSVEARTSLDALSFALELGEVGARPDASVWRSVRDQLIPSLRTIARAGGQHDLA